MENMRWILLLAGVGIVLGIFLISWLPGRLKAMPPRRRKRPSLRTRDALSGEDGVSDEDMVTAELEKLGQLVTDDAPDEPAPQMCEIRATPQQPEAVDKVFSLYVLAPKGVPFRGPILLGALADAGLEYGDMQIFHRHEVLGGQRRQLFSLACAREPGTFDLSAMQDFATDGLVLFFQVPGQVDALRSFESMVTAGRALAGSLGGTLYDRSHSVMTNQTIGHMREEVIDCQLQHRMAKRAS